MLTFDMLLRGDVQGMVLMPVTWQNVPEALVRGHWQIQLAWRPMLVMSVLAALILRHWHRRGWALDWPAGLACLLGILLPWSFGRVMLTRIESLEECGPWLAFMLVSVFLGAVLGAVRAESIRPWAPAGTAPFRVQVRRSRGSSPPGSATNPGIRVRASRVSHSPRQATSWTSMRNLPLPRLGCLCLAMSGSLEGQGMVKDINLSRSDLSSSPTEAAVIGGLLYFAATDATHGLELWVSDGTAVGTRLVHDLRPGTTGSAPKSLVQAGGSLFFVANDGFSGDELYRTDGTPQGTVLVRDIEPGAGSSSPQDMRSVNGLLMFTAITGNGTTTGTGRELWICDGTTAGTVLVKDIQPGPGSGIVTTSATAPEVIGGRYLFSANDGTNGVEPWVSDGTSTGTTLLRDVRPGTAASNPVEFTRFGAFVYFSANNGTAGDELWKTDGTSAGTQLFVELVSGSSGPQARNLTVFGNTLVFTAIVPTLGGEPWISDGTAAGTRLLKDIYPGGNSSSATRFTVAGNNLFFLANDGTHGTELWTSDGTANGTVLASDLAPGTGQGNVSYLTGVGNQVAFSYVGPGSTIGSELWASDGTASGTRLVKDIAWGSNGSAPNTMIAFAGMLYFSATELTWGRELWRSDLTEAGTQLVLDIHTSPTNYGSNPQELTALGDKICFFADDGQHGRELWVSDGTESNTHMVVDIDPRPLSGAIPATNFDMIAYQGHLIFSATQPTLGTELWISDGTEAGTHLLKDIYLGAASSLPHTFVECGGKLYFFASTSLGRELWVSDGSEGGTQMVKDLNPGSGDGAGNAGTGLRDMVAIGNTLFFAGNDGATGLELWKSDGTAAGTTLLQDLNPGIGSAQPRGMCSFGNLLMCSAYVGLYNNLVRSDGTPSGTYSVFFDAPATNGSQPLGAELNGYFYFAGANPAANTSIFRTDGTPLGTSFVFASSYSTNGGGVGSPLRLGNRLIFGGWSYSTGTELYVSDGTPSGTTLLEDVFPGQGPQYPNSGYAGELVRIGLGNVAIYRGADGVVGSEAWITDGTPAGTYSVSNFVADPSSYGYVTSFTQVDDRIFCVDTDGIHGTELYVLPLAWTGAAWARKDGDGCPGTGARVPAMNPVGVPSVGNGAFACRLSDARPSSVCAFEISGTHSPIAIGGGCTLHVGLPAIGISSTTDATGSAVQPLPIPDSAALIGASIWVQAVVADPAGAWFGVASFSDALRVLIGK